jgi:5-methylcytosine-specific restriction endonuclease McrA
MPRKIELKDVKKKLPEFLTIYDETYKGVRYKARFHDIDYLEDFEAIPYNVIKLQHGCKTRSNYLRSKSLTGINPRKEKVTLDQFKPYIPNYLEIYDDTYKDLRSKAKFRDIEYKVDFWAYPFNIKRDGKGYCKERKLFEFRKTICKTEKQINKELENIYGKNYIKINIDTYKSGNKCCEFFCRDKIIKASLDNLLQGHLHSSRVKWDSWKTAIKKKFNSTCAISGKKEKLECHHIFSKSDNPKLKFDENNGILLCYKLHREFHSKYGKTNNNLDQLIEFAESKGVDLREKLKSVSF